MKILIVDDNPRRYRKLNERLATHGISRDNIDIVTCAMDAREHLSDTKYDLLVLDLILPLRVEDDPAASHSEELLREITEFETLLKPRRIVGLTAYHDQTKHLASFFAENVWTIIDYSDASDEWILQVLKCVDYVQSEKAEVHVINYQTDVAIICALPDPEAKSVLKIDWNWDAPSPLDDTTFINRGKFKSRGQEYSVVLASAERMGMVSSALLSAKLISLLRPRLVVMLGICAGVRGKVNLGDIIFADPSWDWQSGKRMSNDSESSFAIAPHHIAVDPLIRSKFELMRRAPESLGRILDAWQGQAPDRIRLHIGPLASGSAVLADSAAVADIRAQHRELLGVEMEAYGVYSAARSASAPRPLVFALKSVCDFGDGEKNDQFQSFCSYASASYFKEFCEGHFFDVSKAVR